MNVGEKVGEVKDNLAGTAAQKFDQATDGEGPKHAREAKQAGAEVASTAAQQAQEVVAETRRQAADLLQDARGQMREQAGAQKGKVAEGLRALSDELRSMSGPDQQGGPAADIAHQGSQRLQQVADWLDNSEPDHIIEDVRAFARRKPGTFLLGAAAAGFLAGRVIKAAAPTSSVSAPQSGAVPRQQVSPTPSFGSTPPTAVLGDSDPLSSVGRYDDGLDSSLARTPDAGGLTGGTR